jgi:hypothetical protein
LFLSSQLGHGDVVMADLLMVSQCWRLEGAISGATERQPLMQAEIEKRRGTRKHFMSSHYRLRIAPILRIYGVTASC